MATAIDNTPSRITTKAIQKLCQLIKSVVESSGTDVENQMIAISEAINELNARVSGLETPDYLPDIVGNSIDTQEIPKVGGCSVILTGAGAPSVSTDFIGQVYIDTTNAKFYFAKAVGNSSNWVMPYVKASTGIPSADLASAVQTSLGKADSSLQPSNIVTSWSSTTSDSKVPSEKLVKDTISSIGGISSFEVVSLTTGANPHPDVLNPSTNIIYLTKDSSSTATDPYTEWIYFNSNWEIIGETSVDLSNYVEKVNGTSGNIVVFGSNGAIQDSNRKTSDFIAESEQCGGVNLLSYELGRYPQSNTTETNPTASSNESGYVVVSNKGFEITSIILKLAEQIHVGDVLTLSFTVSNLTDGENFYIKPYISNDSAYFINANGRYSFTFESNADIDLTVPNNQFDFSDYDTSPKIITTAPNGFTVSDFKMEKGRIATAYTRNPKEYYAAGTVAGNVSNVAWDSTNKKITKTLDGTTSDVVTASTLKTAMSLNNVDNTSDVNKPISTATQTALNGKEPTNTVRISTLAAAIIKIDNTNNTRYSNYIITCGYPSGYNQGTYLLNGYDELTGIRARLVQLIKCDSITGIYRDTNAVYFQFNAGTSFAVRALTSTELPTLSTVDSIPSTATKFALTSVVEDDTIVSGKADKSGTVSNVAWDSTNNKITKTINNTTTDVVSASALKIAMGLNDAVHISGAETITGQKAFKNNWPLMSSESLVYSYERPLYCYYGTDYSEWDSAQKDGNHFRRWRIKFSALSATFFAMRLKVVPGFYNANATGYIEKMLACRPSGTDSFPGGSFSNYTAAFGYAPEEFRINSVTYDSELSSYVIEVVSSKPESNNSFGAILEVSNYGTTSAQQEIPSITIVRDIIEGWPSWAGDKNTAVVIQSNGMDIIHETEQVGGVNIASCVFEAGTSNFTISAPANSYSGGSSTCSGASIGQMLSSFFVNTIESIKSGEIITVSFDVSNLASGESFTFNDDFTFGNDITVNSNGRFAYTVTANINVATDKNYIFMEKQYGSFHTTAPNGFTISNYKIERGKLSTAYTRHPSEVSIYALPYEWVTSFPQSPVAGKVYLM